MCVVYMCVNMSVCECVFVCISMSVCGMFEFVCVYLSASVWWGVFLCVSVPFIVPYFIDKLF